LKITENLNQINGVNDQKMLDSFSKSKSICSIGDMENFFRKLQNDRIDERISEFFQLFFRIEAFGSYDFVTIDFDIVRGLAYYTGFVFDIFACNGQSHALAGGGRYDNLVKKRGYTDLSAIGFAIGDVILGNLLNETNLTPKFSEKVYRFIVFSERTEALAL
jgi:histidyl-tRNA synthetase